MESPVVNNHQIIKLNFSLEGLTGPFKQIILIFPGSTTSVSVDISKITSTVAQYLPFTCSKPLGVFTKKTTHPKNLSVTIEKAQGLVLKALKFEQGRSTGSTLHPDGRVVEDRPYIRREKDIELDIPLDFEPNQKYTLALTSISGFGFSAKLVKSKVTTQPISETSGGSKVATTEGYREGAEKFKKTEIENFGGVSTESNPDDPMDKILDEALKQTIEADAESLKPRRGSTRSDYYKKHLAFLKKRFAGTEVEREAEIISNSKTIPYLSLFKKP